MTTYAACTVDFEHMNYTVITSQCKGPNYAVERCCPPLKQLLCPVHEQFNDARTNCPETFFSYVNLYGKYRRGSSHLCAGKARKASTAAPSLLSPRSSKTGLVPLVLTPLC
ncbi:UNVERIFIED_CONTAM: GPI-anchored protein LLG1 [Sesamum radiatum]|uniref:GPI-anchored protein LLG1 n=1 Tax=Sesamum radiatum TaxID=300843 RepID=A0AAW2LNU5_SESRA